MKPANIYLLYGYSVLIKRTSAPIMTLYFLLHRLTFFQIAVLASIVTLVRLCVELYGGLFVDRYGAKYALMLSSFWGFLTMLFYGLGRSFGMFACASVMYGLSISFLTGSREVLLTQSLQPWGLAKSFKKYFGRMLFWGHALNALVLLWVPLLYEYHPRAPFVLGMVFFLLSAVLAACLQETSRATPTVRKSYRHILSEAVIMFRGNMLLMVTVLLSALSYGIFEASDPYVQPLLRFSGIQVYYFGMLYALKRLLLGIGAAGAHRISPTASWAHPALLGFGLMALSLVGAWLGNAYVVMLSVLGIDLAQGLNRPVLQDILVQQADTGRAATLLSLSSLFEMLFKIVLVLAIGGLADLLSVSQVFGCLAGVLCTSLALLMLLPITLRRA